MSDTPIYENVKNLHKPVSGEPGSVVMCSCGDYYGHTQYVETAPKTDWTPQPKIIAAAVTGITLTVVVGAIAAITPEHFAALGVWGGVVYGGVVALGSALGGYIKKN